MKKVRYRKLKKSIAPLQLKKKNRSLRRQIEKNIGF